MKTIKVLICKNESIAHLLIGKEAEEELKGKFQGLEYHEFDVAAVYGVPELVEFALNQEFRLGVSMEKGQ